MTRPRPAASLRADVLLVLLAALVFGQVAGFPFLAYDDGAVVTGNPVVRGGLTPAGVRWALTTTYLGNWIPLTWLSHLVDVQLFGLAPAGHHLVSLGLHAANAVLLRRVLLALTGAALPSLLVSAVFAVHPLHAESVAWITLRRDLLMGLFGTLSLAAWIGYLRRPSAGRYAAALLLFCCGLASKALLVTLPLVLLLLDFWPLGRLAPPGFAGRAPRRPLRPLLEKAPFLLLAAAIGVVTYRAQAGNMLLEAHLTLARKLLHPLFAYGWYLRKSFWPAGLAVYYPYSLAGHPAPLLLASGAALAAVTAGALLQLRRRPWLAAGWLWFAVCLLPVAGLVQVGGQAVADRYTYFALTGLAVAVAWSLRSALPPRAAVPLALAAVGALAAACAGQLRFWKSDGALFEHALAVTRDNDVAHNNLGVRDFTKREPDAAAAHFREAIRINPRNASAQSNLALVLLSRRDPAGAAAGFREALRLDPGLSRARRGLVEALAQAGKDEEALAACWQALAVAPDDPSTLVLLGEILARRGDLASAAQVLQHAERVDPGNPRTHRDLADVAAAQGRTGAAAAHRAEAARLEAARAASAPPPP